MMMVGRRFQMTVNEEESKLLFSSHNSLTNSFLIFILFLFFSFICIFILPGTAEADLDENLKGVPPSSISEWNYYGFSAEESKKWIEEGIIFAGWASQWRDEGFDAAGAGRWHNITNVHTAGDFLKNGFDAPEAEKWIANGIRSGLRAREYLEAGLSAGEAASYWTNGIYPDKVKEWRDAGFNAKAMMQWHYGPKESAFYSTKDSSYGRTLYSLEKAIQWRDAGFSAREMQTSGLYRLDLDEAKLWKAACFTFDETVRWRDLNFALDAAILYRNSGFSPEAAEFHRFEKSEDKPDEITSLNLDITLNRDGSVYVVEQAAVIDRPGGMYEKGYFKALPKQARLKSFRSHGHATRDYSGTLFDIKSVEIDGKASDYYVSGDVLHFGIKKRALSEGEHLINIAYLTDSRVLYEPHHDEFCFDIIEDNPEGRYIKNASATVRLPKGAHVIFTDGNGGLDGRNNYVSLVDETPEGDVIYFALTSPLKKHMSFTANVGFIKGYVLESKTHKFKRFNRKSGGLLTSLASFGAAFGILFSYYLIVWFRVGRDPKDKKTPTTELSPPENMDPAMARSIHTKGKTDHISVAAELLYLAEHGLIVISKSPDAFKIERIPVEAVKLPPTAKRFYNNLWAGIQTELLLTGKDKCETLSVSAQSLKTMLKDEHKRNMISNSRYLWPGIILAVLAIVFSLAIIDYSKWDYGKAKIFISIYIGFMATLFVLLSLIFRRLLRTVTENYAKLSGRVESYLDYVVLMYADTVVSGFVPAVLQEHLPYAIAAGFDLNDVSIHKGDAKWYHGKDESFRCGDFIKAVKKSI